jgi:hypothetical protein
MRIWKQLAKFNGRIIKRLLDKIIMPANWFMNRLDPHSSWPLPDVHAALKPNFWDYNIFLEQHEPKYKAAVDAWDLDSIETYLDILDTAKLPMSSLALITTNTIFGVILTSNARVRSASHADVARKM